MKKSILSSLGLASSLLVALAAPNSFNVLSAAEKAEGWRLLWDGQTSEGWRTPKSETFPQHGWEMTNGVLSVGSGGEGKSRGGDIITKERFSQFELTLNFKIAPGANSGIKYFVQLDLAPIDRVTGQPTGSGAAIGLEYQILDDANHPDAKAGHNGNRTMGSLYDLIPAIATKQANPAGDWNTARIVATDKHVEHWLNGQKVLEYDRGSESYRKLVAESKYRNYSKFGEWSDGHILLQDHGDQVSFRNIKIRTIIAK